jgi:hypothetical protein
MQIRSVKGAGTICSDTSFPLTLEDYGRAYTPPQRFQLATPERTSVDHALKVLPADGTFSLESWAQRTLLVHRFSI